jgi:hypothetical protein
MLPTNQVEVSDECVKQPSSTWEIPQLITDFWGFLRSLYRRA